MWFKSKTGKKGEKENKKSLWELEHGSHSPRKTMTEDPTSEPCIEQAHNQQDGKTESTLQTEFETQQLEHERRLEDILA